MRRQVRSSAKSPRPHDTGMVTLISGSLGIRPARSRLPRATRRRYPPVWPGRLRGDPSAVVQPERQLWPAAVGRRGWPALRLFGKPEIDGPPPHGVTLAVADSVEEAVARAKAAAAAVIVEG